MNKKALVLGNSYMNLEMKLNRLKRRGNVEFGDRYSFHPYGKSAASAITIAKMGGNCIFCTKLSDDSNGNRLRDYYTNCNIDLHVGEMTKEYQTGQSITLYDDTDECTHYVSNGVNVTFTKEDVDEVFSYLPDLFIVPQEEITFMESKKDEVVVENNDEQILNETIQIDRNTPYEPEVVQTEDSRGYKSLVAYACESAIDHEIGLVVEYNQFTSSLPLSDYSGIKILVISDEALHDLTGFYMNSNDAIMKSLSMIKDRINAKHYIVQSGNNMAFVYDGDNYKKIGIPGSMIPDYNSMSKKMNETFLGAVVADYMESKNVTRASVYGVVSSILTKSRDGVLEHVPTSEEIEQFIKSNRIDVSRW
ncbi:MAG: hypothetical protein K6F14_08740 [Clostridiales bacterium]|nr:hypothetical protein [Clostridiales bacterium]